ncbi:universal stress protein [Streptomyces europaeiscabiei]|uniref:universal stress protein n=1 Tax=Streptomyces europaeiscabiei TaxID=146819 RepID=UPI0038D41B5E
MLRPVVVGLDGSSESLAAADWAAREALRRGLPLRLVHAWPGGMTPAGSGLPELDAPRHRAQRILRDAMDRLDERYPQVCPSADQISRPAGEMCAKDPLLDHELCTYVVSVLARRLRSTRVRLLDLYAPHGAGEVP